jgi:TolB-like protein/Flp pilus assembly protein TadD
MDPPFHGAVRFGAFELDTRVGELRKGRERLHLQPQPFRVLSVLVSRPGQLVTREELQRQLWHRHTFVDFEQGLNVCIRQIRAVLSDNAETPRFVETVPRRGYRFIAARIQTPSPPPNLQFGNKIIDSLAVLPFENSSGDSDLEYLSQGIAESLINSLSQLRRLRVVPRGTAFRYKGRTDLGSLQRELNIRALVTGRVFMRGESVNVQAELVDLASESQLWGGQYHRKLSDIFEVQEEISRQICLKLRLRLSKEERKGLRKRHTQSPEAYQLYLKGHYSSEKRTTGGLWKGIEYFYQAIEKDPEYALAYTGLADSYTLLGSGTYGALPGRGAMEQAKAMAVRALAIDDTLAEAHASLAFVRFRFDWAWSDAEREFKRAIDLNPRYMRAHHWYALFLAAMGRGDEAIQEIKEALKLDPLALIVNTAEGRIWHFAREYDRAIEQFQKTLQLDSNFIPAHFDLGACYQQKAMFQKAVAEFQTAAELSGGSLIYVAAIAEAYARWGKREEALQMLNQLEKEPVEKHIAPSDLSLVYSGLGEKEQALSLLEEAYEQRDASLVWSKVAPEVDPLRSEPRFRDLLRRMNFPK